MCRGRAKCYLSFRFFLRIDCQLLPSASIAFYQKYNNHWIDHLAAMAHISCYRAFFFQSLTLANMPSKVILLAQLLRQFYFSFSRSSCNHWISNRPFQMNLNFFSSEAGQPKKRFFSTILLRNLPHFWFFYRFFLD